MINEISVGVIPHILTTKENDKVISLLAKINIGKDEIEEEQEDGRDTIIEKFTVAKESYPRRSNKDNR